MLVLGQKERGNSSVRLPLVQKLPIRIKNLDPLVVTIGDLNFPLRVDHHVVGKPKLTGPRPPRAKLE